jgi:hypothetical protein
MDPVAAAFLDSLTLGEPQTYRHVTVFPLMTPQDGVPPYLTLGEALTAGTFTVTEVSQSGSVPELLVLNRGGEPVLLLDGEELIGAKQNRVLNTTIMLRPSSRTVIPVSCTERGRWAFASTAQAAPAAHFQESDAMLEAKIRSRKVQSVSESLASGGSFASNQSEVWSGICELSTKAAAYSPTHAMHDVFKARDAELAAALDTFMLRPGQKGLVVLVRGRVTGLDALSLERPYAQLHRKLIKSHVLDALLDRDTASTDAGKSRRAAHAFLRRATRCNEERFESVGQGVDARFLGRTLAGNALLLDGRVVHTAFFRVASRPGSAKRGASGRHNWRIIE